jgi:glycosyltransferase involved in cell wall biosynthesis
MSVTAGQHQSRSHFYAENNFQLSSCKGILVLQPLYRRFFNLRFKELSCLYLPELIDLEALKHKDNIQNDELLLTIKAKSQGRKIVAMLGNITPRKNLSLFLESATKLDAEKYFILVLGKLRIQQSPSLAVEQEKLNSYRCFLSQNSYMDTEYFIKNEQEFSQLIEISDILFNHYKDYPFSSSIVTKAMAHRKPVIVDKGYLMEKVVNQYNWRVAVEENADAIARAIKDIIEGNYVVPEASYQSFMADHSPERFKSVLLQACEALH